MFLQELVWTFLALLSCLIIGYGFTAPFRHVIKYWFYATPFAGLLIITLGTSALYSILELSLANAAILTALLCSLITCIVFFFQPPSFDKKEGYLLLSILLIFSIIVYFINYTSIHVNAPGFIYMEGTDHLGYVQFADWLRTHLVSQKPIASPAFPLQSWVRETFQANQLIGAQRFGSYFIIGIASLFHGTVGMFVYDFICGVILCAAVLGNAAVFSRSKLSFLLLLVGFSTCIWLDYTRNGFFAKAFIFPATLFLTGVILQLIRTRLNTSIIGALAALTCAAATLYPATTLAFMLFFVNLLALLFFIAFHGLSIKQEGNFVVLDQTVLVVLMTGVAIATTGALAIPAAHNLISADMLWYRLIPYLLETQSSIILGTSSDLLFSLAVVYLVIDLIFFSIAWYYKHSTAMALTLSPLLILALILLKAYYFPATSAETCWIAFQFAGFFFPLTLCGAIQLLDYNPSINFTKPKRNFLKISLIGLIILLIATHIPRLMTVTSRYMGKNIIPSLQFSEKELNQLAKTIGNQWVVIEDMQDTNHALPLLVYLTPLNPHVRWSAQAWHEILGYRHWPAPAINPATHLFVTLLNQPVPAACQVRIKTRQYQLLDCRPGFKLHSK